MIESVTPKSNSGTHPGKSVEASDIDLDRIAGNASLSDDTKIEELSRRFEVVILKQMLKTMNTPMTSAPLLSAGPDKGMYGDLALDTLAESVSRADQIGFSRMLERQLKSNSL